MNITNTVAQLSATNAGTIAAQLNERFAAGVAVVVNGQTLTSRTAEAVTRHGNGSLSFRTVENPGKRTYVKVGHMVHVTEGARPSDADALTTTRVEVSEATAPALALQIIEAVKAGRNVTINGQRPVDPHGSGAAHVYSNGTVSFKAEDDDGNVREVLVRAGETMLIVADNRPTPPPAPKRRAARRTVDDGKVAVAASADDRTGWLICRRGDGKFAYSVTTDARDASRFTPGRSLASHIKHARAAGISITEDADLHVARAEAAGIKVAA